MKIKYAVVNDAHKVMYVIKDAQLLLKSEGVDQWQNGFPNIDVIKSDIENRESFVCCEEDGTIVGFFSISFEEEESYREIFNGEWLQDGNNYATIHRTGISSVSRGRGLSTKIFHFCEKLAIDHKVDSIRIDTHKDNKRMRHIIIKNGFEHCGDIVLFNSNDKRVVYEKLLYVKQS
ncbi:MAG: GNAT family N-acetyltransferase [Filifactoraceae bacterium]